jgi:4-hydroxy-tetrahydrodipicolinate reductase
MRVIHYGLGPIGLGIARLLLERGYQIVGAVDIDPAKVGRDLGSLLDGPPLGIEVTADPDDAMRTGAQIAVHSTGSRLLAVLPQLEMLVEAGLHVASTCEELAFPWRAHAEAARRLDALARRHGVTVVGLGVNPGFAMDALPLLLTAPCGRVDRVVVERRVDVGRRREQLQHKVGVGLTPAAFTAGVREGRVGHVGLPESAAMIADALGWDLADLAEEVHALVGPDGLVMGIHQVVRGRRPGDADDAPSLLLDLQMAVGLPGRDAVTIHGHPTLQMDVAGGIHGDVATWAIVANALPLILEAPAGLCPVARLPLLHLTSPATGGPPEPPRPR